MNSQIKIYLSLIFFIAIIFSVKVNAQESAKPDSTEHEMEMMDCSKDKAALENSMNSNKETDSTTVSEINVGEFDKNNDGKVFIDEMCPDVIKDEPGNCPKCGMKLKEVSLEQAKKNLAKHGFKVK